MERILLIGDPAGPPDEGMRKIGREILARMRADHQLDVRMVSAARALTSEALHGGVDIVHYLVGPTWRSLLLCSMIKRVAGRRTKSIVTFLHPHWSMLAEGCFEVFTPDAVIVQSNHWQEHCRRKRRLQVFSSPISGVDFAKFRPVDSETRSVIRSELGFGPSEKVVLHVGHLNRGRNLEVISKLAHLPDVRPVVITSTTVQPDEGLRADLSRQGIEIVREFIPNIERFYQAADCYLFPTVDPQYCVQLPLSVLEALAAGLPVVSSRFEGLPFFLADLPGITFVEDFSGLPEVINSISKKRTFVSHADLEQFSWRSVASALVDCYQTVLRTTK